MVNQIVISWDSTGSMYSCLTQVRKNVESTVRELFRFIPNLEIGCISHGDYVDGPDFITKLDLTSSEEKICQFVRTAPRTGGGDKPEAYEAVINTVRRFSWNKDAKSKAFVLIGDDIPHPMGYHNNKFDWYKEAKQLHAKGVLIYSIQCLGNNYATEFYERLAEIGQGYKLDLEQFSTITDLLKAICYRQADSLPRFEEQLHTSNKCIDISLLRNLDILRGRTPRERKKSAHAMWAVHPARFQLLEVDKDTSIRDFVEDNELIFEKGRGFYEFTKPVVVQEYKEVVIQDKDTGEMFTGDKAREILGLPIGKREKVKPGVINKYRGFIQSTSTNRKLLKGTKFLYEVS